MGRLRSVSALGAIMALGPTFGTMPQAEEAHVHGEAQAAVIIERESVTISLVSSMYNLVGFERAPRNAEETQALADVTAALEDGAGLFEFPDKAKCRLETSAIHFPGEDGEPHKTHDHEDHADHDDEGHADLEAQFDFVCEAPDRLTTLSFDLIPRFDRLQRMETVVLAGNRQVAHTLTHDQYTISFGKR